MNLPIKKITVKGDVYLFLHLFLNKKLKVELKSLVFFGGSHDRKKETRKRERNKFSGNLFFKYLG
jgi:hypothetical protein